MKYKDTAQDFKSLVSTNFTTRAGEEGRVIIAFPSNQTLVLTSAIPQNFRNYRVGLAFLPSLSRRWRGGHAVTLSWLRENSVHFTTGVPSGYVSITCMDLKSSPLQSSSIFTQAKHIEPRGCGHRHIFG